MDRELSAVQADLKWGSHGCLHNQNNAFLDRHGSNICGMGGVHLSVMSLSTANFIKLYVHSVISTLMSLTAADPRENAGAMLLDRPFIQPANP